MCLDRVYAKKEKQELLDSLPEEFTVWKVLVLRHNREYKYKTDCRGVPVYAGEMRFKCNVIDGSMYGDPKYRGGGHFWLHKEGADYWGCDINKTVKCRIDKRWITNIGTQDGIGIVVVAKKAIFPKYVGERPK